MAKDDNVSLADLVCSHADSLAMKDTIAAAIDSLKSALFHLKQSTLDTEGTYGLRQVESTLLNLERRRGKVMSLPKSASEVAEQWESDISTALHADLPMTALRDVIAALISADRRERERDLRQQVDAYLLMLDDIDKDEWYTTERGICSDVLEKFLKWLPGPADAGQEKR